jgi:hypothetical protein
MKKIVIPSLRGPRAVASSCSVVLGLLLLPDVSSAQFAASSAGSQINQPNWQTAGYGSTGHIFFGADGVKMPSSVSTPTTGMVKSGPSWLADPEAVPASNFRMIGGDPLNTSHYPRSEAPVAKAATVLEGLAGTGGCTLFGLNDDNDYGTVKITFGAGVPSTMTVGVLVGAVRFNDDVGSDVPAEVSIGQLSGSSTTWLVSQATTPLPSATAPPQADWYFFELTGVQENDVLVIGGKRSSATAPDKFVNINGLVIDAAGDPGPSDFANWISTNYPSLGPGKNGPHDDPDHDGLPNLVEFAIDGDPTSSANRGKRFLRTADVTGDSIPELSVTMAVRGGATFTTTPSNGLLATADGVIYTIGGTLDLANIDETINEIIPAVTAGLPALSDPLQWEYHTFTLPASSGLGSRGFILSTVAAP